MEMAFHPAARSWYLNWKKNPRKQQWRGPDRKDFMSTLPLSVEAYDQFQQLIFILDDTQLLQGKDQWSYIWGSTEFASNKAYLHLMGTRQISPVYTWLWNSYCQPKRKVFFWLVLKDRLSTQTSEKENYGVGKLQLCALSFGHWRVFASLVPALPFCYVVLECVGFGTFNTRGHSGHDLLVQDSNSEANIYGDNSSNVLGNLVY